MMAWIYFEGDNDDVPKRAQVFEVVGRQGCKEVNWKNILSKKRKDATQ